MWLFWQCKVYADIRGGSEDIASERSEHLHFRPTHSHLTPPLQRTLTNIRIKLTLLHCKNEVFRCTVFGGYSAATNFRASKHQKFKHFLSRLVFRQVWYWCVVTPIWQVTIHWSQWHIALFEGFRSSWRVLAFYSNWCFGTLNAVPSNHC